MASEQSELLFFDTFSHETSENINEDLFRRFALSQDLETNIDDKSEKVEYCSYFNSSSTSSDNYSPSSNEKYHSPMAERIENFASCSYLDICDVDIYNYKMKPTDKAFEFHDFVRDFWLPSNRTEMILALKPTDHIASVRDMFTFPEIHEDGLTSKFDNLEASDVGVQEINLELFDLDRIPQNGYDTLLELVRKGDYRAAVNLTAQLLLAYKIKAGTNASPSYLTPESIQLWFARLSLLVKMQEFNVAVLEVSHWGDCDKPDLYYQFYPGIYPGRHGSMVPFQMRLLLANLPSLCGQHAESLEKLFKILAVVKKIQTKFENEAKILWEARNKRVLISILNVAMKMKDFILAVDIMNGMIKNENSLEKKKILYSILGRIHLHFGDVSSAEDLFLKSQSITDYNSPSTCQSRDFDCIVDMGLLAVAQNDFSRGYQCFEQASFIEPSSLLVLNNCAVCLLYLGHLKEGIRLLNGALTNDPIHALQESLLLNLSSMYDLDSSNSKGKKSELLNIAKLFKGSSINVSFFRML